MLIAFSGKSDTGKARANNQDYIGLPPASAMEPWLFVLADGMGGASGGEVASRLAVETVVSAYNATRGKLAPSQALTKAVKAANLAIYRKAEAEKNLWGMGTTVVAALVGMDRLLAAHVGDSRLYILRQGALNQITRDHSLVQDEVDQGIITKEQAKTHQMKNVLTRAVGAKPEVEVDLNTMELQAGDVIMACSDGLHGPVGRREIEALLGEDKPVDSVCQELIDAANGAGGPDNVSAIVVRVEQTGAAGGKDTTVRQGAYDPGADTARRRIKAADGDQAPPREPGPRSRRWLAWAGLAAALGLAAVLAAVFWAGRHQAGPVSGSAGGLGPGLRKRSLCANGMRSCWFAA